MIEVFNQIDSVMLGLYGQIQAVGLYSAAYKLIGGLLIPAIIFNQVIYPKLARQEFLPSIKIISKNLIINFIIYLSLTGLIYLYGADVLEIVFGYEYKQAAIAFYTLSIAMLLTALVIPMSNWTIARDYLKVNLVLSVIAAIINIILNYLLIPLYSYEGAALATVITYLFLFIGYYLSIRRYRLANS